MKFETLKSFNKKKLIIPIVIISCLIIVITIFVSHAKYISKDSITIMDDEVNYKPYDFKTMAIYQQKETCTDLNSNDCYEEKDTMPSKGYTINQDKSYCYIDDENNKIKNKVYTNEDGEHVIKELPKRSKCVIYFIEKSPTFDEYVVANSKESMTTFTSTCGSSTDCSGVYEAIDDDGISYYYRGSVENNYVKFGKMGATEEGADIWWRIIRRNGDGSVRMIFAGTSTNGSAPKQNGEGTVINNGALYKFNDSKDQAEYVGYQYTLGQRKGHGEGSTDSVAKTTLEVWFLENLNDEFTADNSKIDKNAGFCGDRSTYNHESPFAENTSLGTGATSVRFGAYTRNEPNGKIPSSTNPAQPTFRCPDKANDLYTYKKSNKGTQSLEYPIGLITADEVTYAGGLSGWGNSSGYLSNGQSFWTISGNYFLNSSEFLYIVYNGSLNNSSVSNADGLRPVLNLVSGALTLGSGLSTDPYRVS